MEIRIANIDPKLLAAVKQDARNSKRTIGKQAEYILALYYANDVPKKVFKGKFPNPEVEPVKGVDEVNTVPPKKEDGAWRFGQ